MANLRAEVRSMLLFMANCSNLRNKSSGQRKVIIFKEDMALLCSLYFGVQVMLVVLQIIFANILTFGGFMKE